MHRSPTLRYFSYLASGLSVNFAAEGKEWIKFFNPVNFVKFVGLPARKMNGDGMQFARAIMETTALPFGRRAS